MNALRPSTGSPLRLLLIVFAATACSSALAATPPVGGEDETPERIEILQPREGMPIFDRVSVAFRLHGIDDRAVESARVFLDGFSIAEIDAPPWITTIDAGVELTPRELTFEVLLASGRRIVATRRAPALQIGESLDVRLVNLSVSVTDASGRPLRGLGRKSFRVKDGGKAVKIERWSEQPEALAVSLVMDASVSMRGERFTLARKAALTFVDQLEERDEVGLVAFNDEILKQLPVGADASAVASSLESVRPHGGTALYDAIHRSVKQLVSAPPGMRRVMVVVSDGRDAARQGWQQASTHSLEEALRYAHSENVIIYTLGLGKNLAFEKAIAGELTTKEVLESFARTTGGRLDLLEEADDLEAAYNKVIEELRHHYSMAFTPSDEKLRRKKGQLEGWRPIEVSVDVDDARVRTRQGYFIRD